MKTGLVLRVGVGHKALLGAGLALPSFSDCGPGPCGVEVGPSFTGFLWALPSRVFCGPCWGWPISLVGVGPSV